MKNGAKQDRYNANVSMGLRTGWVKVARLCLLQNLREAALAVHFIQMQEILNACVMNTNDCFHVSLEHLAFGVLPFRMYVLHYGLWTESTGSFPERFLACVFITPVFWSVCLSLSLTVRPI